MTYVRDNCRCFGRSQIPNLPNTFKAREKHKAKISGGTNRKYTTIKKLSVSRLVFTGKP